MLLSIKKVLIHLFLVIDAAGQVGRGVYNGNVNYLGNYQQYEQIKAPEKEYAIQVGGKRSTTCTPLMESTTVYTGALSEK